MTDLLGWYRIHGADAEWFFHLAEEGTVLPPMAQMPRLGPSAAAVWKLFNTMSGPQAITASEFQATCDIYRIDARLRPVIWELVRGLDRQWRSGAPL